MSSSRLSISHLLCGQFTRRMMETFWMAPLVPKDQQWVYSPSLSLWFFLLLCSPPYLPSPLSFYLSQTSDLLHFALNRLTGYTGNSPGWSVSAFFLLSVWINKHYGGKWDARHLCLLLLLLLSQKCSPASAPGCEGDIHCAERGRWNRIKSSRVLKREMPHLNFREKRLWQWQKLCRSDGSLSLLDNRMRKKLTRCLQKLPKWLNHGV